MVIDPMGYLSILDERAIPLGRVPLARTLWNLQRNHARDRLAQAPWGIVLHWYGDKEGFDKSAAGYLRGFDSLRLIDDYFTRTSAHFLVADGEPSTKVEPGRKLSILQTQSPDMDGTPFLASHLQALDYQSHYDRKQYFVRAFYQLNLEEPAIHSILQDFFDGPTTIDPNFQTIAIEMTGYGFEHAANFPPAQQIANAVAVIWAVMRRYEISVMNILGHHEIQLGKSDPGKKFMAYIRFLLGVKALIEKDEKMKRLVFGSFLGPEGNSQYAIDKYFKFVRDFLMLVGRPQQVYEWESLCGYWLVHDAVTGSFPSPDDSTAYRFTPPLTGLGISNYPTGYSFLTPENHEGVDLYLDSAYGGFLTAHYEPVQLVTKGTCIYAGEGGGMHPGKLAMFRHRQADGAEIISIFSHLSEFGNLQIGNSYPVGFPVGSIRIRKGYPTFLHLAIAYGSTWDLDLQRKPDIPPNAGLTWIQERFLEPVQYMRDRITSSASLEDNRYLFE
jgi:N-acetyl-anhydromuramyl-L-alanine amidase AmpD